MQIKSYVFPILILISLPLISAYVPCDPIGNISIYQKVVMDSELINNLNKTNSLKSVDFNNLCLVNKNYVSVEISFFPPIEYSELNMAYNAGYKILLDKNNPKVEISSKDLLESYNSKIGELESNKRIRELLTYGNIQFITLENDTSYLKTDNGEIRYYFNGDEIHHKGIWEYSLDDGHEWAYFPEINYSRKILEKNLDSGCEIIGFDYAWTLSNCEFKENGPWCIGVLTECNGKLPRNINYLRIQNDGSYDLIKENRGGLIDLFIYGFGILILIGIILTIIFYYKKKTKK